MFLVIGKSIHWIRSRWYLSRMMEAWLRALRALCAFSWSQATVSYYSSDTGSSSATISLMKMLWYARTTNNIDQVITEARRNGRISQIARWKKRIILRRGRK